MGLKERLKVLALLALEMEERPKAKGSGASRSGSSEETDSPPRASERNRGCPHLVWLQGDRSWSPDNTVQFPEATWVGCFVTAQKEAHDLLPTLLASVTVGEGCEQCLPETPGAGACVVAEAVCSHLSHRPRSATDAALASGVSQQAAGPSPGQMGSCPTGRHPHAAG